MPVYDYRCNDCGGLYDVYHKTREAADDLVCPSCGSTHATRLMSVPSSFHASGTSAAPSGDCGSPGGCCGGTCRHT